VFICASSQLLKKHHNYNFSRAASSESGSICIWILLGFVVVVLSVGRRAARAGIGAQQQMWVASCWQPTKEAQHRLVISCGCFLLKTQK